MRYMGGKSRIAKKIAPYLTRHERAVYVEPFVGGAAVLTQVARDFSFIHANDGHGDLIDMYRALQAGWLPPSHIGEDEYKQLRHAPSSTRRTFAGYGCAFGGRWFGGYARSSDGRSYATQSKNSLMKSKELGAFDPHVRFTAIDFFNLDVPTNANNVVVYADPPYEGTHGYNAVGKDPFNAKAGWERYHEWARAGAHVYVSEYNGPSDLLIDTFTPQSSMKGASSNKVKECLYYIPPTTKETS